MAQPRMEGEVVAITGASGGIGEASARLLAGGWDGGRRSHFASRGRRIQRLHRG